MAPQTVEAFGGALNLVNSEGSTTAKVAEEVVTGLDDWIAKLDIWKESQASTGALLENGVGFLHQFEQMLDNVGIAIDNLMKADPGTAHYLMDLVVGFTKVLDVITEIPAPILQAALGLHSFMLWGGLLFTGLTKLLVPIRALALGVGGIEAASSAVGKLGDDASGLDRLKASLSELARGSPMPARVLPRWHPGSRRWRQAHGHGWRSRRQGLPILCGRRIRHPRRPRISLRASTKVWRSGPVAGDHADR